MVTEFTKNLLDWNQDKNTRVMPWKGESDPYRIWLSEIILQQTRVQQGLAYYNRFITVFPTITDLANAPEQEIFKYWEGLGYYSRCRNLISTARKIAFEHDGHFPSTYETILELPGVGPYTAAAIASFAFQLPHAVVDGNVERVLARYFGLNTPTGSAAAKKLFKELAGNLLDKSSPGLFNQAIMDFGATICKPQNPLCDECVQAADCLAFQNGWTRTLPVKLAAPVRKRRWFTYFIIDAGNNETWIRRRIEKDIWRDLYEFVLLESGQFIPQEDLASSSFLQGQFGNQPFQINYTSPPFKQTLTHQLITGSFVHLSPVPGEIEGYHRVARSALKQFPFPRVIANYLNSLPDF